MDYTSSLELHLHHTPPIKPQTSDNLKNIMSLRLLAVPINLVSDMLDCKDMECHVGNKQTDDYTTFLSCNTRFTFTSTKIVFKPMSSAK